MANQTKTTTPAKATKTKAAPKSKGRKTPAKAATKTKAKTEKPQREKRTGPLPLTANKFGCVSPQKTREMAGIFYQKIKPRHYTTADERFEVQKNDKTGKWAARDNSGKFAEQEFKNCREATEFVAAFVAKTKTAQKGIARPEEGIERNPIPENAKIDGWVLA